MTHNTNVSHAPRVWRLIKSAECTRGNKRCVFVVGSSCYSKFPQTYNRRRKIYEVNHKRGGNNDEAWDSIGLLLDALGTRGMSDDETDNELAHSNPDRRFKTLRRIDTGFLTPEIADIWAAVETYPSSAQLSRGNRSYKHVSKARQVSKKRIPIPGLPANFYHPEWLCNAPRSFRNTVRGDVALPVLVSHHAFILSGAQTHCHIRCRITYINGEKT
jgi:hypothetical protein